MIARSAKLILATDFTILLLTVVTSMTSARALGPAGRGDLLLIALWPVVIAMITELGLPNAYRYWMAREPERVSQLFSNAVIYALAAGTVSVILGNLIVPHLIAQHSTEVMLLMRIYMINIPAVVFLNLMRALLDGTRRFGWSGAGRLSFFGLQAIGFAAFWMTHRLTVATATYIMLLSQVPSLALSLIAVRRNLRPGWQPSWKEFKSSMSYALRDYPGNVADYTTLRLDQLMLGAMASNVAIGLYVVAVRLSEMTTMVADAIADALMPEVASSSSDKGEAICARSFRLAIYMHLLLFPPLWLAAPLILRVLFGQSFVPATSAFRWLLVAAGVWSCGSIVISGLRGFGHPGLSTLARFSAAVVTGISLLVLLPRMGITGAAIASLIGYSVMLAIALVGFAKKRQLSLWRNYLRPQKRDLLIPNWRSLLGLSSATQ